MSSLKVTFSFLFTNIIMYNYLMSSWELNLGCEIANVGFNYFNESLKYVKEKL